MSTLSVSTLDVDTIDSKSGTSLAFTSDVKMPTQFSHRNKIINGGMRIAQRGTVATTNVTGTPFYGVDRFVGQVSASGAAVNFAQSSDGSISIIGPSHVFLSTNTIKASLAAGDYSIFGQRIEGFNITDLRYGTASARTVTLSFRARVDNLASAVMSVALRNGASNRSYVTTVNLTNSTQAFSITVPGDITGTWTNDSSIGLEISFAHAAGTTYSTANLNTWQAGNFIAATTQTNMLATVNAAISLTDVQLEVGSVATPFEHRPYGVELALCQRYYNIVPLFVPVGASSMPLSTNYPVEMRTTPTVSGGGSGFTGTFTTRSIHFATQTTQASQTLTFSAEI